MQRRNGTRCALWLVMAFLLCALMPAVLSAAAPDATPDVTPVRVGYYEDGDYMSRNQQGEYVGFNIEFLQELAKYSGRQFEIVDTGSWSEAYRMLTTGEIDLLPAVYFSEQRAEEVLFVTQPMCSIYTTLNVRMDDDRYDYEAFDAFQGMRVGIIKDGADGAEFKQFCAENKIDLTVVDYEETNDLLGALENGTLDGVAITHLGKNSAYRSVAQFSPSPLYLAVSPKSPALLSELNSTMNTILLNNPGYTTDLYDKYLSPSANQKPAFTKAERQYIEQTGVITVSYDPDLAPLSYLEEATEEFAGVTADIFDFIAQNSQLRFRFEPHPQAEALQLLQQGAIDILCVSDGDYLWNGRNHTNSTLYYLRIPTSVISAGGSSVRDVIALPEGYHLSETVAKDYPDSTILYYPSATDCLEAVRRGQADATYLNTQVAGFLLHDARYSELVETTLSQYPNKLCVAVSSLTDPNLFSILNKCIQYLPAEQTDAFMIKNSVNSKDMSLVEFVEEHTWAFLFSICLVLGLIIFLVSNNLKNALRSNRKIQHLLYKDPLTCLENLNGFCEHWATLAAERKRQSFILLYGDICRFQYINDTFGFSVGDSVLMATGETLQRELKPGECCARVSADNFILLLRYESWEQLTARLDSCVEALDAWRQKNTELPYKIELVFGAYRMDAEKQFDIHQVIDSANYARRHAKSLPNSFVMLYDEQMRKQAILALQLTGDLEKALVKNEFEVYYQPKVSMENAQVIGSEALIRWNHTEKGFLTPGVFIPLFEKNGMIKQVDFWLFETVCRALQAWAQQGKPTLPVSCNFSRLHFKDDDFPDRIVEIADRYQVAHHLLEVEITESALIEDSDRIATMLPRLKALGFQISIDDFGSGYSSLGQLQRLDTDVLKLDRSFVAQGITETREQIVLRSIIQMAGELGITVICEGVETHPQAELLQTLGCRFAQGFFFYRPMPVHEYERLWD